MVWTSVRLLRRLDASRHVRVLMVKVTNQQRRLVGANAEVRGHGARPDAAAAAAAGSCTHCWVAEQWEHLERCSLLTYMCVQYHV